MRSQGPLTRYPRERKYRRFDLQFPVALSFPAGEVAQKLEGVSENVSLGGLLVNAGDHLPLYTRVNLIMKVVSPRSRRPVLLRGEGRVVRVEYLGAGGRFAIAVQCEQPITEMEPHPFAVTR